MGTLTSKESAGTANSGIMLSSISREPLKEHRYSNPVEPQGEMRITAVESPTESTMSCASPS